MQHSGSISSISLECKLKQTAHTLTDESSCQSSNWVSFTIKCVQVFLVMLVQKAIAQNFHKIQNRCVHTYISILILMNPDYSKACGQS